MARQRRSFSTEFKSDAASLVVNQGYSIREASRSLLNAYIFAAKSESYSKREPGWHSKVGEHDAGAGLQDWLLPGWEI